MHSSLTPNNDTSPRPLHLGRHGSDEPVPPPPGAAAREVLSRTTTSLLLVAASIVSLALIGRVTRFRWSACGGRSAR
jgi:hypothetical protein